MSLDLKPSLNVTVKLNPPTTKSAYYYLMKNGFILRLEEELHPAEVPLMIKANMLDPDNMQALNQDQANYRVAIFRDEILELDEYQTRVFGYTA
jgi:hypothetical protein